MLALGLFASRLADAQPADHQPPADNATGSLNTPPADQGAATKQADAAKREKKLVWRGTSFSWANRVTAQTLGVGNDYQSSNPYYEWFFSLRPRYYFWGEGDDTLSLRATLNAYVELTNSDTTTKEHEFLIDDSTLALPSLIHI